MNNRTTFLFCFYLIRLQMHSVQMVHICVYESTRVEFVLTKMDTNGDGSLSRAEFAAAMGKWEMSHEAGPTERGPVFPYVEAMFFLVTWCPCLKVRIWYLLCISIRVLFIYQSKKQAFLVCIKTFHHYHQYKYELTAEQIWTLIDTWSLHKFILAMFFLETCHFF